MCIRVFMYLLQLCSASARYIKAYIHIYMHTYIHTYKHTHTHLDIPTHMQLNAQCKHILHANCQIWLYVFSKCNACTVVLQRVSSKFKVSIGATSHTIFYIHTHTYTCKHTYIHTNIQTHEHIYIQIQRISSKFNVCIVATNHTTSGFNHLQQHQVLANLHVFIHMYIIYTCI